MEATQKSKITAKRIASRTMLGASQLVGHKHIRPMSIHNS